MSQSSVTQAPSWPLKNSRAGESSPRAFSSGVPGQSHPIPGASISRLAVASDIARAARVPADLTIWATGAAPLPLLRESKLPKNEAGFIRVNSCLQVEGHPDPLARFIPAAAVGARPASLSLRRIKASMGFAAASVPTATGTAGLCTG